MASVTGYTAERMKKIEDATVIGGHVNANGDLILERFDGQYVTGGHVAGSDGAPGSPGPPGVADQSVLDDIYNNINDNTNKITEVTLTPKAPTNIQIMQNTSTFDTLGKVETKVYLIWDLVVSSVDNKPIGPVEYQIWASDGVEASKPLVSGNRDAEIVLTTLAPAKTYKIGVRAKSVYGTVWSDLSEEITLTTLLPPMTANKLTKPTLTSNLGLVFVNWDGLGYLLPSKPPGFQSALVEYEINESGEWKNVGVPAVDKGQIATIREPIGTSVQVRLQWVDTLGRRSLYSSTSTIVVSGIAQTDLVNEINSAIETAKTKAEQALASIQSTVKSITTQYALSNSETVAPTTGWSTTPPTRTPNTYIWSRNVTTYIDNTTTTSSPLAIVSAAGPAGADGISVSNVTPYYLMVGKGTPPPAKPTTNPPGDGWSLTEPGYTSSTELYRADLVVYSNSSFKYTDVTKVSSYTAASQANTRIDGLSLRGNNLVTNGNGLMGNNTNFSYFNFSTGDQPPGTGGAFSSPLNYQAAHILDEAIPINPNMSYLPSIKVKQANAGVSSRFYFGLVPHDSDGLAIGPSHYLEQAGTRTTLAQPLTNGQTTITLTSAANWNNSAGVNTHLRSIIIWDYVDGSGKKWEPGTYSRNSALNIYNDGGIVNNVINLSAPWSKGTIPAGTVVSNGASGGTYMYALGIANVAIPSDQSWATFVGTTPYTGVHTDNTKVATTSFPIPTVYVKPILLCNYTASGGISKQLYAAVSLSDVAAANQAAANAVEVANLADAKAEGMVKASSTDPGHQNGRIWLVLDATGQIIGMKTSNGSTWSSYMIMADQILVPSSVGPVTIAEGAVTASKLNVVDFQNYFKDPSWSDPAYSWSPWVKTPNVGIRKAGTGAQSGNYSTNTVFAVKPGEKYQIKATRTDIAGSTGTATIYAQRLNASNVYVGTSSLLSMPSAGELSNIFEVPADSYYLRIGFYTESNMPTTTTVQISDFEIRRMVGTLIEPNSVTTNALNANEIWANEAWLNVLRAGVIEVDMVVAGFGENLELGSNSMINLIIDGQTENTTNIASVQDAVESAAQAAVEAGDLAATAQGAAEIVQTNLDTTNGILQNTTDEVDNLKTWFRVDSEGAHMGRTDSPFQTHMFPDRFAITDNGIETTYWKSGVMNVASAEVTNIILSNHQIAPYDNGGTVIRAVGV